MKFVVVGFGNLGRRRATLLGNRCVATVDPVAPDATHRRIDDVPTAAYDAAIVATPNDVKRAYVAQLVSAGKSVLVEKPLLFESRGDAIALQRRARDGAIWYTSYNHRFEPMIVRMKTLLDEGAIGKIDRARFVYGNGTVRDWVGTWRESGAGILDDLGCHVLDLCGFLLGHGDERYVLWDARAVESATLDYALFSSADRRVVVEIGNVFWKNTFQVDVYGNAGSLHLDGLGKWWGTMLVHRTRVLPSGAPDERREEAPRGDRTWEADLLEFERRVAAGDSSLENDCRISAALSSLREQAERSSDLGARPRD